MSQERKQTREPWRPSRRMVLAGLGAATLASIGVAVGLSGGEEDSSAQPSSASFVTGSTEANSAVVDSNTNVQTETKGNEGNTSEVQPTKGLDFELETLEGETLRLSDYRGKVVLVGFWGSTTSFNQGPGFVMSKIETQFPDVQSIGVMVDNKEYTQVYIEGAERKAGRQIDFPVVFAGDVYKVNYLQETFPIRGYPDYVVFSPSGKFVDVFTPAEKSEQEIATILEKAASEN